MPRDVFDLALQHRRLDRRTDRDNLVGVYVARRLTTEELLHDLDDLGHAGHAADQDHLVDLTGLQAGILECRLARLQRALDQVVDQRLELGARQLDHEMLGAARVRRDERQVDLGLLGIGELDLGLLGGFLEALQRKLVVAQVDALLLLELLREVGDHPQVEVLAAQEGVAVGGLHLEHAVTDLEHRHVERAAAQVVDRNGAALALVHAVGKGSRRRLVDDAQHVEAGDAAGVLGGLALGVVEVGRDGDDRLLDLLAEIGFGGLLHLPEDERRDLARAVLLAVGLDPGVAVASLHDLEGHQRHLLRDHRVVEAAPDQALHRVQGLHRVSDGLALGGLANQPLTGVGESDHRGGRARTLGILDHLGVAAFHDRDAGIGRAEIDTNDFCHDCSLFPRQVVLAPKAPRQPPKALPAGKTGSGQGLYRS
jgi:NAD-specific glutamate dehydrogenase